VIRLAFLDDIPAMHVVRTSVRENVLSSPDLVTLASYREKLEGRGRGWVYEPAGRIVGFSVADFETQNIWALFVAPDYERRGIGRQLLDHAIGWLFARGVETIWLTTAAATRAEGFYRRAGWHAARTESNGEIRFELRAAQWLERQLSGHVETGDGEM
jgi:GNAT superfamily N-acetyltransferase